MFNPTQTEVREFFFNAYAKSMSKQELTALERLASSIIQDHPNYLTILDQRHKYLDYQWSDSTENPFLHMSLHLTILEQLSINQPAGIRDIYQRLMHKYKDKQMVEHYMIEALMAMLYEAQSSNIEPNLNVYFAKLTKLLES